VRDLKEDPKRPDMHQLIKAAPGLPLRLRVSPGEENIPLPMIILIKTQIPSTNPRVLVRDGATGMISSIVAAQTQHDFMTVSMITSPNAKSPKK
jgi:hypothetical protein